MGGLRELLKHSDCYVVCPKCGDPAKLRFMMSVKYPQGGFQYAHSVGGKRTTHQGDDQLRDLEVISRYEVEKKAEQKG